ncbi:MAG: 16S rRNA (cytosine(1402)-N(4))-methyltransferase RsmH [Lachnospiraceae bacterium]|nr:16S rRNA (cytosine(1402)-N(4))-methyltransferase RsmH [Lachnospiraceae bacterium]
MEFKHYSVMLNETIEGLNIKPDGAYLDGTLGGAGHSSVIASKLSDKGRLYGVDQDEDAIAAASERLKPFKDRVTIVKSNYREAIGILKNMGVKGLDGILLDLGVSSFQLDNEERGFSYRFDTSLDMRMDKDASLTARDIVNTYSKEDLARIIENYGEDRFARNIAKHIVEARAEKPIETTFELNEIIKASIPMKIQATGGHPSKRTFQAIRIECNHELEVLKESLDEMIDFLNPGGRIAIITFHSLEDRIVKDKFKEKENPCICPPNFPVCVCGRKPLGHTVTRKPIVPTEEELNENSRSKSAKLRIFERI